jgi:3-oxoacyl-[acyl-carrier protein] reductase
VVGLVGVARGTAYVATKWALRGMNECWREELYPDGIKVAYVAPGYVITEFGGRKEDYNSPEAEWALTPQDVAHTVEAIVDQGPNSDIREVVIQVRDRS